MARHGEKMIFIPQTNPVHSSKVFLETIFQVTSFLGMYCSNSLLKQRKFELYCMSGDTPKNTCSWHFLLESDEYSFQVNSNEKQRYRGGKGRDSALLSSMFHHLTPYFLPNFKRKTDFKWCTISFPNTLTACHTKPVYCSWLLGYRL